MYHISDPLGDNQHVHNLTKVNSMPIIPVDNYKTAKTYIGTVKKDTTI